ncbi:conserved hypothetical protein [Rippkaea orientalis PCC 8801]|uniref:Chromophore lyase CpcS/CpeS n=1 Tax=Rippkaea orientalis (strain PCC 8801 / RF-1) TaxID=41431 RepID=B7K4H7_RIPO1|nr:phycobiliprotein lyase [Rippkaea orientalis]ACK65442.1 conserved hypothetical protein [Rippkaea orientalis PCC 8801]
MTIQEFLELCVGNWFSQRSSYHFEKQQAESHKSELTIEWLDSDHPQVIAWCQHYQIDSTSAIGGKKISWNNSLDWGQPKQIGSTIIVVIPDPNMPQMGQILRGTNNQNPPIVGRYSLGSDRALTLQLEENNHCLEERLWFASDNLRLRTSLIKSPHGFSQTAFYSEIRKLPPKEVA